MAFLSEKVRDARWTAMRRFMAEHELDALAFLTEDWVFFAGNYYLDVRTWERPVAVVVPRQGEPFALFHELSTNHLRLARDRGTIWIDDVTLYSEHPRLTNRLHLAPQWPQMVAEALRGHGLARARIGVDARPGVLARAEPYLPGVEFIPMETELRTLRLVKEPEELELIRQAADVSDWAQARYRENIRPDRLTQELDYSLSAMIAEEGARRFPGENLEIRVMSLAGAASAAPHGTGAPTGARIQRGDGIVNIIVLRLNGLAVENERTYFCGEPSAEQRRAFEAATAAQEAAIGELVAGNSLAAVDGAALAKIVAAGFESQVIHRTGHGIGINGHEFPEDMAFNPRPLLEREVYSSEPGIYIYGLGGFRHDDTVIVGKNAPEVVTRAPKDLESQIVR